MQTTKRGLLTTNKGGVSSTGKVRDIQPVLLSGVSKGACPLAHDFACKVKCVIRSVGVAAKIRLPPGRAKAFEAAGKQGCDCVTWSRKRRTGFISRRGVYESPRSSFYTELVDTLP